jgi:ligand-binding sensor domain-containing protein
MKPIKYAILLLTLNLLRLDVNGQEIKIIDKTNSNIPDVDLWSVAVDSKGNKWIGTLKTGLIKYDGSGNFEVFNRENSKVKGNLITPIYNDRAGNIWFSFSQPEKGLGRFDGQTWTTYSAQNFKLLKHDIVAITEGDKGTILIGTLNGIVTFDGTDWTEIVLPNIGIDSCTVRAIAVDSSGKIAVGHNEGLLLYTNGKWQSFTSENSELQMDVVRSLKFTKEGRLYIGYGGGLRAGGFSIFHRDKWTHYNKVNSKLPDQMVRDIEIMKDGTIWMATNDGVLRIDRNNWTPIKFREGRYKNAIMDISIENDNTVWIATGFGLIKYVVK